MHEESPVTEQDSPANGPAGTQKEPSADLEEQVLQRTAELQLANEALRKITTQFEAVYDHQFQMTGLIDTDGRLIMANRTALEFAGIKAEDVVGRLFWETPWWSHSQDERSKLRDAMERALRGEMAHFESTHVSASGELRIIDFRIRPAFDESGKVVYLVPEGYDITERKQAEARLRRQAKFDTIIGRILTRFARCSAVEADASIQISLEEIGRFVDADTAYIVLIAPDGKSWSVAYGWVAPGFPDYTSDYQNMPMGERPWTEGRALAGEVVAIRSATDLPPEAASERRVFERDGVRSELRVPLRGRSGQVTGILGFRTYEHETEWRSEDFPRLIVVSEAIASVLERKRVEKAQLETLARFSGFADASQYGMGMADLDGRIVYVNATLARMLGEESEDDCLGKHFPTAYYPPALADRLQEEVMPALMQQGHWHGELELLTVDGRSVPTDENYFVIRDAEGQPSHLADILTDITERKRAEEALRENEARLRNLSDNMPGGMAYQLDMGEDGEQRRFTYVSAGVESIHEVTAEAVLQDAQVLYRQIVEDDLPVVVEREAEAKATMTPFVAEVRMQLPSGAIRWHLLSSAPRRAPNGHLIWDGIEIDITERKQAAEERQRLEAQLLQAQKMEAVGRLAGGVAHDFNNLLMGIMNYAELSRDEVEPDHPVRQWLDEITEETQRSANIVRQLLAFARKEAIKPQVLDLNEAVGGMLKLLRRLIGEDIDLVWMSGANVWPVRMDPGHVDQLLANLCVNARDAIEHSGRVVVETKNATVRGDGNAMVISAAPGDYVVLTVGDTGCGMDADTQARIFEPFFTTKEVGRGTGLGLATVHGIVTHCGGGLNVVSEPDSGTCFHVYLPRAVPAAEDSGENGGGSTRSLNGTETVLLVEDEKSLRVTCQLFLEAFGYTVLTAERPEKALRLAGEYSGEIHLLITDMVMPGMTGHDLAEELNRLRPSLKCLFISGYTADVISERVTPETDLAFLAKPFTRDELSREVRRVLDES